MTCSQQLVFKWNRRFKEEVHSIEDKPREGRPSVRQNLVNDVKTLVNGDQRVTAREVADKLGASYGTVERILTQDLNMSKVSARWVPRLLCSSDMECRVTCSKELLKRYSREGVSFLDRIITLNETRPHHYEPESKRQSCIWKSAGSPPPKKAKVVRSMKKYMFVFVMDRNGMLLIHQVPEDQCVTAQYFSKVGNSLFLYEIQCKSKRQILYLILVNDNNTKESLSINIYLFKTFFFLIFFQFLREHLVRALSKKRPGIPVDSWILHQDNTPSHSAASTQLKIDVIGFQELSHPPYSPDLAPMDFRVFPVVKDQLRDEHFRTKGELLAATQRVVQQFDSKWYMDTYDMWIIRAEKWLRLNGDYVEKNA